MATQVVTISAKWGTGGNRIGPAVADALGLPFVDRAIPFEVSRSLSIPEAEVDAHDERAEVGFRRFLSALASVGTSLGPVPVPEEVMSSSLTEETFREQTESVIRDLAATTGGVILGRGAMLVLRDHPGALHVSLDGSVEARIAMAMRIGDHTEAEARKIVEDGDRTREAYFRHLYRVNPSDPKLYHLIIDAPSFDFDTMVALIVRASRRQPDAAWPQRP